MDAPSSHDDDEIERLRRAMYSRQYADKILPKDRRGFDTTEPDVANDWNHEEEKPARVVTPLESLRAPLTPSRAHSILKWVFIASLIFFGAAIIFFIYYLYFGGGNAASADNIDIAITGPSEIAGGETTNLEISITNRNAEPLELAQLLVTYPPGTKVDPTSCPSGICNLSIGTIAPGATTEAKLPAIFEGGSGQHADVQAQLQYHLPGSNSIFVASSDYAFTFSSSPVTLSVQGNTQTVSGQPLQITLSVASNATQPVSGVMVGATYPFGFQLTSASPSPGSNGLWNLGTLSPGQTSTITLNGVLTGDTGDNRVFNFTAGTLASATSTSVDNPLSNTSLSMSISQPFLGLSLTVNNASSSAPIAVTPGETVDVDVNYVNNLTSPIDNAVIIAKLSGIQIDGTTVQSDDGFYRSTDNAVLWNTTTDPNLSEVDAGASGTLSFSFIIPSSDQLEGIANPSLDISINASGERVDQTGVPENLQSTAEQQIAVASNLEMSSQGLYFTNPFGSTGPMPPQAGVETTYGVVLSITNTTSEIDNAVVTAQLPSYVRWTGSWIPASENVTLNNDTGLFTWNVGTIVPGVGLNGTPPRELALSLGFTPSTSQIGTEPALLQNITLTGTDAATGQSVNITAPDVTTNIAGDPGFTSANAQVVSPSTDAATSTGD